MAEQEVIRRLEKIEKAIDRIERKLSMLMKEKRKETWVKASVIGEITGWDKNGMRRARKNGYVQYKEKDGFWYLLESIHSIHLKKF